MHYIKAEDLAGTYKMILASSIADDNKKLEIVTLITAGKRKAIVTISYRVYRNNEIVNVSDHIALAVNAYNKIQVVTHKQLDAKTINLNTSLCYHCDAYRHGCKAAKDFVRSCTAYEDDEIVTNKP